MFSNDLLALTFKECFYEANLISIRQSTLSRNIEDNYARFIKFFQRAVYKLNMSQTQPIFLVNLYEAILTEPGN